MGSLEGAPAACWHSNMGVVLETAAQTNQDSTAQDKHRLVKPAVSFGESLNATAAVDDQLERILIWSQTRFGEDELIRAKEEFFWKTGKVFHDDPFYEQRMGYFLDCFLLERPVSNLASDKMLTPFSIYEEEHLLDSSAKIELKAYLHSVFQITKTSSHTIVVQDIITEQKYTIAARAEESFKALQKKEIFQGFLYILSEKILLSHGIIFHPSKAARIIKKQIKKSLKSDDFDPLRELARFARQNLRHLRHAHVDPKRVYASSSA